jgi:hypothetical protein
VNNLSSGLTAMGVLKKSYIILPDFFTTSSYGFQPEQRRFNLS